MPNLKEEIVNRLKEFPASITPGQTFEEYMGDLAEDIQADVIKAICHNPNRDAMLKQWLYEGMLDDAGILWRKEEAEKELEHKLDMAVNDHFGAVLHNLLFLSDSRPCGLAPGRVARVMLRAMLKEYSAYLAEPEVGVTSF